MIPPTPRLAFMGTPLFAAHILEALLKNHYHIVAVYTLPPRPIGRGYKVTPSPVHELAQSAQIPVFTPETLKIKEIQDQWKDLKLDVGVVAAYGLLLPKDILEAPRCGCLNVHASLLPRWRGAAPIQRAILAGDHKTGVTIMKMNEGLDTGDILLQKEIPLTEEATTLELHDTLSHLGAEALLEALPSYLSGELQPKPQPQEGVLYAEKLKKKEGQLDWQLPAASLGRKVRALNPWPGTWFDIGKDRIKVLKAQIIHQNFPYPPGTIIDDQLTIVCREGALRPLWVQKEGRAPLSTEEFLRGYELPSLHLTHAAL